MSIYEAIDRIIDLQKNTAQYLLDTMSYQTEIADILQELLDTGGVGKEYMEVEERPLQLGYMEIKEDKT